MGIFTNYQWKMIAIAEKFTYSQFLELDDGKRYEIINGELFDISPSPTIKHQAFSRNLQRILMDFVYGNKLGHVFDAPADVKLDEHNVIQPDLIYISHANESVITEMVIKGAPDLLVEILSPSTFHHDQERKKALYEKFGVKEFWVVDPANEVVEVFALVNQSYQLYAFAAQSGNVKSKLIDGLEFTIEQIRPTEFG